MDDRAGAGGDEAIERRLAAGWTWLTVTHWRAALLVAWLAACLWLVHDRWAFIHAFGLSDTDDNLRLVQVRDWLDGQGWFDLRQYRFDPAHGGADIHWSRIVDLPIAALELLLKPMIGGYRAEMWASALAPLLPLGAMMAAVAVIARRLAGPGAMPVALLALVVFAGMPMGMVRPMRIDHHGWQLAMLAWTVAGMADPRARRGGVVAGASIAVSLAIGLEMVIYFALAGAGIVLGWVAEARQRERLFAFAAALGAGTTIGYLGFAGATNRGAVCDALSSVWLADALLAAALLAGLSRLDVARWPVRLGLAVAAGAAVAAFHALAFPHCLSRLEGISDEATRLWLSHVREAKPIFKHGRDLMIAVLGLPVAALVGHILLLRQARGEPERVRIVLTVAAMSLAAAALLFWQVRTGPAAQLLAVPGAAALAVLGWRASEAIAGFAPRLALRLAVILLGVGAMPMLVVMGVGAVSPNKPKTVAQKRVDKAGAACTRMASFRDIARLPTGTIFSYVDLGPRLIALTRHNAIAGPYHRNDRAIADVMTAFRGDEAHARALIVDEYKADYVLICPDMATSTVFESEAPKGFHHTLKDGLAPGWLAPVPLSPGSPWKLWKVVRAPALSAAATTSGAAR